MSRSIRLLVSAGLLVSACTGPGDGPLTGSLVPTGAPTVAVADGTGPSSPAGSASPSASEADSHTPPAAWLRAADVPDAAGMLGSWTLDGNGSDAPWLPASMLDPISTRAGWILQIGYRDRAAIGSWGAWLAGTADPRGASADWIGGREGREPALETVALVDLPTGAWVLAVRLDRADGRGDAIFYWQLAVS